jgi:eukaryotic-like serine/threonine-protein kinase
MSDTPPTPADGSLLERVLEDQRQRWAGGDPVAVEDYLEQQPALREDPEAVLDLLFQEVVLRGQLGQTPHPDDYRDRFPQLTSRLAFLFSLDRTLRSLPSTTTDPARRADVPLPVVPGYDVLAEVGRGPMGVVYKARQVEGNRLVALKMILLAEEAGPAHLARFRAEALAVSRLHHPNVVAVHDVGEHHGLPFLALEFVEGGTLAEQLAGTPLPARDAAGLVETLARAVHAVHGRQVIHRDLKPSNVLLQPETGHAEPSGSGSSSGLFRGFVPRVTDFGLAKLADAGGEQTATGGILGTPSYLAPEQADRRIKEIGPRTDTYALGAILYECLTGRPPFKGATVPETLEQVRTQDPVPPRQLQPGVPPDLDTICCKCLEKDSEKRYGSADDLADDLRRFLDGRPILAPCPGPARRLALWARRRPRAAALLVVGAVAVLALTGLAVGLPYHSSLRTASAGLRVARAEESRAREDEAEQRRLAEVNGREAERQSQLAQEALARESYAHYLNRIALAQSEWRHNEVEQASRLLDNCPAALRGWEWRYLKRLGPAGRLPAPEKDPPGPVAVDPEGLRLALPGAGDTVGVWDGPGRLALTLRGLRSVTGLAFSPNGQRLAIGLADGTVRSWDTAADREVWSAKAAADGKPGVPAALAFSADGKRLAASCSVPLAGPKGPGWVWVYDADTGQEVAAFPEPNGPVRSVALGPDGRRIACVATPGPLASARPSALVTVWDLDRDRATPLALEGETSAVRQVVFSPDGRTLAGASSDGMVRTWDAATGKAGPSLIGHHGGVNAVAYSRDGKRLASASADHTVKVWDPAQGKEDLSLQGHTDAVVRVAFRGDDKQLVSAGADGVVLWWDATRSQEALSLRGLQGAARGLAFSPDGKRLAAAMGAFASQPGTVQVWDPHTGAPLLTLKGHSGAVVGVGFSPNGKRLASAGVSARSKPGEVKVWDAVIGKESFTDNANPDGFTGVAFSPDGERFAAAGLDGVVTLWPRTSAPPLALQGHTQAANGVAFSPDGARLASAGADGTVRLWDALTGREVRSLVGTAPFNGVAFSPDGTLLATAGEDGEVRLWDPADGRSVRSWRGHQGPVSGVAFSPDGSRLASGGQDGVVQVRVVRTGQEALSFSAHARGVVAVAFGPDGLLASAGLSADPLPRQVGEIKIWDGTPESPQGQPGK